MISLTAVKDAEKIKNIFDNKNFQYNSKSGCLEVLEKDNVLGLCLYELDKEKMQILYIEPMTDIALADGILRSTLHIAAERSIMNAFYSDSVPIDFLKKIDFIKNESEKSLDIDKLFKSCCSCK